MAERKKYNAINYDELNINEPYLDLMVEKYGTIESALYNMSCEEVINQEY